MCNQKYDITFSSTWVRSVVVLEDLQLAKNYIVEEQRYIKSALSTKKNGKIQIAPRS
jgi:hypothetical protein